MRILELFAGIGGMSLGFHAANYGRYDFTRFPDEQDGESDSYFTTAAFVECDPACHRVLRKRFPGVPIHDDVTTYHPPKADIVTGGFPCQDLSTAGKRAGLGGARSGLFVEMLRVARESDAKYILFENSAELVCNRENFGVFAERLRSDGWRFEAFVFTAEMFGLPQIRKRAYVVAYADGDRRQTFESIFSENDLFHVHAVAQQRRAAWRAWRDSFAAWGANLGENMPDIRRNDGLPAAVDRVRMLGNSLIPAIPRMFGLAIRHRELLQ